MLVIISICLVDEEEVECGDRGWGWGPHTYNVKIPVFKYLIKTDPLTLNIPVKHAQALECQFFEHFPCFAYFKVPKTPSMVVTFRFPPGI